MFFVRFIFLFLIQSPSAIACLTENDVKNRVCWAMCRGEGFDTGFFEIKTDSCICGQRKKFKDITDKALKVIPKKNENDEYR